MATYQEPHHGSRIIGTNFQVPNWSYDPATVAFIPSEDSPPAPEEVHPHPQPDLQQYQEQSQLSDHVKDCSLGLPPCPQCQGQKYNFTAYFHSRIFSLPPHDLLTDVEKSYLLKNRLRSLLVSYVVYGKDIEETNPREIEECISQWRLGVEELAAFVKRQRNEKIELILEGVMGWTNNMARAIWEHTSGLTRLDEFEKPGQRMRKAREVTIEFRRKWEEVWVALSEDRSIDSWAIMETQ